MLMFNDGFCFGYPAFAFAAPAFVRSVPAISIASWAFYGWHQFEQLTDRD